MAAALELAGVQLAQGQSKQALESLWLAEAQTRGDLDQTRELLEVPSSLREKVDGRLGRECDELVELAEAAIDRLSQREHDRGAIAVLWQS